MDTSRIRTQAHAPTYERTPEQRKRTGILELVIGANWMVTLPDGKRVQLEALPLAVVLAEAAKEGRELRMAYRDLTTGIDYESPEALGAAFPDAAAMARAGEAHVAAWVCFDLADPQAQAKAEVIERANKARRKVVDAARAALDKSDSIEALDAANAKIDAQEKLIANAEAQRQRLLSDIVGLCSSTYHPAVALAPGQLAAGTQWTSAPVMTP